jgi:AcrR family transcriptional regulator
LFISLLLVKTKKAYSHRGDILKKAVKKSDLSIRQTAKRAGYSRSSYYNHIEDAELAFEILEQYGKALHYDFTDEFPQMNKYLFEDPSAHYAVALTFEEAVRQRDHWREKYYRLLEQFHKLAEKRLDLGED